jgi:5-methylthioadenosine/S-adenosylhomocysteine deaminase
MKMKKLVKNCSVLDVESARGFVSNRDILLSGGRIESIRAASEELPADVEVIDGKNLLAIPGLINAHTHSPEMLGRASHDRLPLEPWLVYMENAMGRYSLRDHYLAAALCAIETLKNGGTSLLDHLTMPGGWTNETIDAAMQAYADAGIRATIAPLIPDPSESVMRDALAKRFEIKILDPKLQDKPPSIDEQMAIYRAFHDKWEGACNGRLKTAIGPGGIQWSSPEHLRACFDLARSLDMGVHTHLMETRVQERTVQSRFGMSAVEFLAKEGMLEPRLSLAHSVWLTDRDIRLIAESGATPVHNPAANMRLGSGFSPIKKFLMAGCVPALGADGCMSGDHQNMFAIMHLAAQIHNSSPEGYNPEKWISSYEVLRMVTEGGAKAIRNPDLRGINKGALADITLLDLDDSALTPLNNAVHSLSFSVPSSCVKHVIVNGEIVVRDKRMTTLDEHAIYAECREAAQRHMFSGFMPPEVVDEVQRILKDRNGLYASTKFENKV